MITSEDLAKIPVFADVSEEERVRLARRAADIVLEPGQWLIREGEEPRFFVILEGELEVSKMIVGQRRILGRTSAGHISGETPVFMGTSNTVSIQALTPSRVARFERQQLQELIRDSPAAADIVFKAMASRTDMARQIIHETPSARVELTGSKYDTTCRGIRSFLSSNRIQYDWTPIWAEPGPGAEIAVTIEGKPLENPTVRRVAEALGFQTVPTHDEYDVAIIGAGPAGMAAAVYGASEGLRTLVVERFAAGGQAGTSSRIENYLGFPAGISGDELSERALEQGKHFGVELLVKRNVDHLAPLDGGHCLTLDGGDRVRAKVVVLATGVSWHKLEFEGHDQFLGRGIVYGASRFDGSAVTGHRIFIVGGGNSAGQAAVFYSGYAAEVVLLVRGAGLRHSMSQYLIEQIEHKANIRVEPFTEITGVSGESHLHQIHTITRKPDGPELEATHRCKALFIMIGAVARTDWLPPIMERDSKGYVHTGRDLTNWSLEREPFALETNMPGIFCAGDVRHNSIKRVASAVGEGSMSIAYIHEYLALQDIWFQASA